MHALLAICLFAGCAPTPRTLQFAQTTQSHRYLQTVRMELRGESPPVVIDRLQLEDAVFTWALSAVGDTAGDAAAKVDVRFVAARLRTLDREEGTEDIADTTQPASPDLDDGDALADRLFRGLIGKGYRYRIDRRGLISDMQTDGLGLGQVRDWFGPLPEGPVGEGATWTWEGVEAFGAQKGVKTKVTGRVGGRSAVHGVACTELHFERRFTPSAAPKWPVEQAPDVGVLCLSDDGRPLRQRYTFEIRTQNGDVAVTAKGTVAIVWAPTDRPVPWTFEVPAPERLEPIGPARVDRLGDAMPRGALTRLGSNRATNGHRIEALVPAPQGARVARVALHHVDVVDATTGRVERTLKTPCTPVAGLAWRSDGGALAIACGNRFDEHPKAVMRYDGDATAPVLLGGPKRALAIAYAGDTLLVGGSDGRLWRWTGDGEPTSTVLDSGADPKDNETFTAIAAAPSGRAIVQGSAGWWRIEADGSVRPFTLPGDDPVGRLGPWRDASRVALALDNRVGIFDVDARQWHAHVDLPGDADDGPTTLAMSADGGLLAAWGRKTGPHLWAVEGKALRALPPPTVQGDALALTADGRHVLSLGPSGHVLRIFDRTTQAELPLGDGHRGLIEDLAVAPDRSRIAAVDGMGVVRIWSLSDGAPGPRWQLPKAMLGDHLMQLAFSTPTELVAVGSKGAARLGPDGAITPLPDLTGTHLAKGQDPTFSLLLRERTLEAWRFGTPPERLWQREVMKGQRVCDLQLSADGSRALVSYATIDRTELRDARTGEVLRDWPSKDCAAALSGDGTQIAVVGPRSNQIEVRDARTDEKIARLVYPNTGLMFTFGGLALDATGRRLALSHRGRVSLFELDRLRPPALERGPHPPNRVLLDAPGLWVRHLQFVGDRVMAEPNDATSILVLDAAPR